MEQKPGLPVCSSVAGASPVVGGVMMASYPREESLQLFLQGEAQFQAPASSHGPRCPSLGEEVPQRRAQEGGLLAVELLQVQGGLDGHDGPDRLVGEAERPGQFALLDPGAAFPQRLDVFPEILLGMLLGQFPDGGLDGRQAGGAERAQRSGESCAPSSAREAASQAASSTLRVKMPG